MTTPPSSRRIFTVPDLEIWIRRINQALETYSDKDWNYSRICLTRRELAHGDDTYELAIELLDTKTEHCEVDLKTLADEIRWGERHSNELGMLEIASLRINKALLETTSDEYWQCQRPVIRVVKNDAASQQSITMGLWYKVQEVAGEDFENR